MSNQDGFWGSKYVLAHILVRGGARTRFEPLWGDRRGREVTDRHTATLEVLYGSPILNLYAEGTPLRKTMLSAAVVGAVVVVTAGILAVTNAQAQTNPSNTTSANPLGVSVIRFAPGTTRDAMYAAAKSANATVVTDLSKINALAVVSDDKQFTAKARGNAAVRAVWSDKLVRTSEPDPAAGDSAGSPQIGNPGTDPIPDPWHNATSFLGETNPEGILQWDDNRMNVPAAWSTTRGAGVRWRSSTPASRVRTRNSRRTTTARTRRTRSRATC